MARGQAIGSAGELIVQARLLVRGWSAGNLNTGGMMNARAAATEGAARAKANTKLTFNLDHSDGATQSMHSRTAI